MNTVQVTPNELTNLLNENVVGAPFVTLLTNTEPSNMRKTNNPYWDRERKVWTIRKITRINGQINWSYANAVNNQRNREQTPLNELGEVERFIPAPRQWGERINGTPFVYHNNNFYLELKAQNVYSVEYVHEDGHVVDVEELRQWIPTHEEGKRQQVEHPVILRDYKVTNIVEIKFNKTTYQVI